MNGRNWLKLLIVALFMIGLWIQQHLNTAQVGVIGQAGGKDFSPSVVYEQNTDLISSCNNKNKNGLDLTPCFIHKKKSWQREKNGTVLNDKKLESKTQAVQHHRVRSPEQIAVSRSLMAQQELAKKHQKFLQEIKNVDLTTLDLRKSSGLHVGQADTLLKGTGLEGLGKAFVEAEKNYGVNAFYLIAHAAWESGWGKSRLSREKNNLFGFMAYDRSPYRSAKAFKSKEEGIDVVAEYISKHYLDESGKYYNGATLRGMNKRYATDKNWDNGIAKVIYSLIKKLPPLEQVLVCVGQPLIYGSDGLLLLNKMVISFKII